MAAILDLPTKTDQRGSLTVIEKILPFEIRRVYYIWGNSGNFSRGGHSHLETSQALIAVSGRCSIGLRRMGYSSEFILESPDKCLLLEPEDWHSMYNFSSDCVLLVLASKEYDPEDYVTEEPS